MNREYIVTSIKQVEEIFTQGLLSPSEKLAVIANVLLDLSKSHLTQEFIQDIGNGKVLSYELLDHPDNIGLQIAVKAHLLLSIANNIEVQT